MRQVLVTAGAAGIGRAMAAAFAQAGYGVAVTDVDQRALDTCPPDWRRDCLDVTDETGMAALARRLGPLDALCANAGIAGATAGIAELALEEWRRCIAVNLDGAFLTLKHFAPLMAGAGRGAIVLTSSTAGQHGYPNRAAYAAAKWGVLGLMKTAAMEFGPAGLRVNAICPGVVAGARMDGVLAREAAAKGTTPEAVAEGYASGTSLGQFVGPEDVAAMAVFLASDAACKVSGQVIAVDGHTVNPDPQV